MKPFERQAGTAGFTLVEVLISLAVVAVSLAAIGSLIASSVRGVNVTEDHLGLVETARAIVSGLPDPQALKLGSQTGETSGYRWRVDVSPYPAAAPGRKARWVPRAVVVGVAAPSGASIEIATVRLGRNAGP